MANNREVLLDVRNLEVSFGPKSKRFVAVKNANSLEFFLVS